MEPQTSGSQATLAETLDNGGVAPVAPCKTPCKHSCRDKATCGHLCCKRHLPVAGEATKGRVAFSGSTQERPQAAGLQQTMVNPPVEGRLAPKASNKLPCKHTCRDKATCGHLCCKRHLPASVEASDVGTASEGSMQESRHSCVETATGWQRDSNMHANKSRPADSWTSASNGTADFGTAVAVSTETVVVEGIRPLPVMPCQTGRTRRDHAPTPSMPAASCHDSTPATSARSRASEATSPLSTMTTGLAVLRQAGPATSDKVPVADMNDVCGAIEVSSVAAVRKPLMGGSSGAEPVTVFVYDIESTGLSVKEDRIIEIAFRHVASGDAFSTLVNCYPHTVNRGAYRVHGISTRRVHDPAVPTFKVVGQQILDFIAERCAAPTLPVLVAHNGMRFDHKILSYEMHRAGLALPPAALWLDTLPLARQLLPTLRRHSQPELREHLGIPKPSVEHRALDDVLILEQVFVGLTEVARTSQGLATGVDALLSLHPTISGTFTALLGTLGLPEVLSS